MSSNVQNNEQTQFTEDERYEIDSIFETIATDENGSLDLNKVINFLKIAELPEELGRLVFFLFGGDDKNEINKTAFENFFGLLNEITKDPSIAFKKLFDKIDKDKSGEIDREELKHFMEILDIKIGADELNALFSEIDSDGNGTLSFDEVKKVLDLE